MKQKYSNTNLTEMSNSKNLKIVELIRESKATQKTYNIEMQLKIGVLERSVNSKCFSKLVEKSAKKIKE